MFFVSGITGKVGGATARKLLREGHQVRALARDADKAAAWSEQGVDVHEGDLNDAQALARALQGVEGAFLMIPPVLIPSPGFPEARAVIASFQKALSQSPPPRLVLLSSIGSEQSRGLGNISTTHLMEEALGSLPFPTAFVRAGAFIENNVPALERAAATGQFNSFLQPTDRSFSMIATQDIGEEIARLLAGEWSGQKIVEIGSPVSPDDLARAMSEVLGRPVQAQAIPRENWTAATEAMGFPRGSTGLWEEMMDGFNSNWISFGAPGAEAVAGTATPAQVFALARRATRA